MPKVGVLTSLTLPQLTQPKRPSSRRPNSVPNLRPEDFFAIDEVHCTPRNGGEAPRRSKLVEFLRAPISNPVAHFQFRERSLTPVSQTIFHEMCRYDACVGRAVAENYARLTTDGRLFELVFRERKLGFTVVLARLANSPRTRLVVDETFETCPAFHLLMPTDELIAINGSLLIPIDMEAFPALVSQLQHIDRPLRLTFAKTVGRTRAFQKQQRQRLRPNEEKESAAYERAAIHIDKPRPLSMGVLATGGGEKEPIFLDIDQELPPSVVGSVFAGDSPLLKTMYNRPNRAQTQNEPEEPPTAREVRSPLQKTRLTSTSSVAESSSSQRSSFGKHDRHDVQDDPPVVVTESTKSTPRNHRLESSTSYDSAKTTSVGSFVSDIDDEIQITPRNRRDIAITLDRGNELTIAHIHGPEESPTAKHLPHHHPGDGSPRDECSCGCVGFDDAHCVVSCACFDGGFNYYTNDDVPISPPGPNFFRN